MYKHVESFQLLPFDLRVGRLIAIGARCGHFVNHALLIAVALSNRELFKVPYRQQNNFGDIFTMSHDAQNSRGSYTSILSDALLAVPIYKKFILKIPDSGISYERARKFVSSVSEIARTLENILPDHAKWLKVFRRNEKPTKAELNALLPSTPKDYDFLRLMLAIGFKTDGLMTTNAPSAQKIGSFKNDIDSKDFDRTVVLEGIPNEYCEIFDEIVPDLANMAEEMVVGRNGVALLFPYDQKTPGITVAPLGVRIARMLMTWKGDIAIPTPENTVITAKAKTPSFLTWRYEGISCRYERNSIFGNLLPSGVNHVAIPGTIQYVNDVPRIQQLTIIPNNSPLLPIICLLVHKGVSVLDSSEEDEEDEELDLDIERIRAAKVDGMNIPFEVCPRVAVMDSPEFIAFQNTIDELLRSEIGSKPSNLNANILAKLMEKLEN